MTVTLDIIERGLRRGLPEARDLVRTPEAALAVAERLLREDPAAADFNGRADHLAGYLRHVAAHGRVDAAAFEAELSDTEREALWLADWERSQSLRDDFNSDRAAYLAYMRNVPGTSPPAAKPVATATTATPAPAPAPAPRAPAPAPSVPSGPMVKLDDVLMAQSVTPVGHNPTHRVLAGLHANGIAGHVVDGEVMVAEGDVTKLHDRAAQRRLVGIALGFVKSGSETHVQQK